MRAHAWPGNVRELENVMQRAMIMAAGDLIEADALHLPRSLADERMPVFEAPAAAMAASAPLSTPLSFQPDGKKTDNMRDLEREHILDTLTAVGGSRKLAGERLGMSERTLRHKLKQYREAGLFKE